MRRVFGCVLCAVAVALAAGPAEAKFFGFRLEADRTALAVGEPMRVTATISDEDLSRAAAAPALRPPVDIYRQDQLPASGPLTGVERPVKSLVFDPVDDGMYVATVSFEEPGTYVLVSMNVWNHALDGYPEPIPVTIAAAHADRRMFPRGVAAVAFGLALGVVLALAKRALSARGAKTDL